MANELVPVESNALTIMPAMTIQEALQRRNELVEFTSKILRVDEDYGKIPGTKKNTLLKAGAEKLTTFFGLTKKFVLTEKEEDWTGERHNEEPFFFYTYKCQLLRGNYLIAESEGSCNSWESKYRWRNSNRKCPSCGSESIIKTKGGRNPGGYWCVPDKGGCGANFNPGAPEVENQQIGKKANPDIFDQVNTIQKMAQKRALIAATLLAVNASEFFTQDMEDFAHNPNVVDAEYEEKPQPPKQQLTKPKPEPKAEQKPMDGQGFLEYLANENERLWKQERCAKGELIDFVQAEGLKCEFPAEIKDWKPGQIHNAKEFIEEFWAKHPKKAKAS